MTYQSTKLGSKIWSGDEASLIGHEKSFLKLGHNSDSNTRWESYDYSNIAVSKLLGPDIVSLVSWPFELDSSSFEPDPLNQGIY